MCFLLLIKFSGVYRGTQTFYKYPKLASLGEASANVLAVKVI